MAQKIPVILNDDKTQHIPLGSIDTIRVSDVPVSTQEGNTIQTREDGLYVGTTAPADISTLYVSASLGNDMNAGTRDAPLQSLDAAMEMIASRNAPGSYVIRLKAGESFSFKRRTYFPDGIFALTFCYYDDPRFGDILQRSGYYPEADERLNRPTVIFDTYIPDTSTGLVDWNGFYINNASTVRCIGLKVTFQQSGAGQITGGAWAWYVREIQFAGCDVTIDSEHEGIGSAKSIITRQCNFYLNPKAQCFISDYAPGWFDNQWVAPGASNTDPLGVGPEVIGREFNMRSVVTPANGMALATYDASTKTLFGWDTTWDIFAGK